MQFNVIVTLIGITLVSSFLQGLTSFGFPLIAVPLFSMILPIQTTVPVITLLCLVSNVPMLKEVAHVKVVRKEATSMVISSIVTIPLGVLCLRHMAPGYLKIMIGSAALICALLLAKGIRLHIKKPIAVCTILGLVSGFLVGLANVAGPVLIILFSNLQLEKKVFRGFMVLMFASMGVANVIISALNGLITREVLFIALVLTPIPFIGTWIGSRISKKVNEKLFRTFTLILLILSSLSILSGGLVDLGLKL